MINVANNYYTKCCMKISKQNGPRMRCYSRLNRLDDPFKSHLRFPGFDCACWIAAARSHPVPPLPGFDFVVAWSSSTGSSNERPCGWTFGIVHRFRHRGPCSSTGWIASIEGYDRHRPRLKVFVTSSCDFHGIANDGPRQRPRMLPQRQ